MPMITLKLIRLATERMICRSTTLPSVVRRRGGSIVLDLARLLVAALVLVAFSTAARADERLLYPRQFTMSPKGVNVQNGRFIYSKTDLTVGDLSFTRSWNAQSSFWYFNQRSLGLIASGLGVANGWNHSLNQGTWGRTTSDGTRVTVTVEGQQFEHAILSSGTPVPKGRPPSGTYLRKDGANWRFTDKGGTEYYFFVHPAIPNNAPGDPDQLLQQAVRPDGTVLSYSYRSTGQLQEVRSSRGYAIHLDYDGNNNVSKVCGYNIALTYVTSTTACLAGTPAVSYGYDGAGSKLVSVLDQSSDTVTIQYDAGVNSPSCITLANSATCELSNVYGVATANCNSSLPDQVTKQTTAAGIIFEYCFEQPENPNDVPYFPGRPRFVYAWMTDPGTGFHGFRYDRGRLVDHESPSGTYIYRYPNEVYDGSFGTRPITFEFMDTLPWLVELPDGNFEYRFYNKRGNITGFSQWPIGAQPQLSSDPEIRRCCISLTPQNVPNGSLLIIQGFLGDYQIGATTIGCVNASAQYVPKLCDKPISRIEHQVQGVQIQTDYEYDSQHGGIAKETGPPVGGVRPQTRYSYIQKYAFLKASGSGYVQAATPVWLLASKSFCKVGAASGNGCAITGDEVVTTYEYGPATGGPNNLLLTRVIEDATGPAPARTCYTYDWQGNRISETKARGAGTSACP